MMLFTQFYKFLKLLNLFLAIWRKKKIETPILISHDGTILDGSTRVLLARHLGIPTVPAVRINADIERVDPEELKITY